jgi:hypothetical protein
MIAPRSGKRRIALIVASKPDCPEERDGAQIKVLKALQKAKSTAGF